MSTHRICVCCGILRGGESHGGSSGGVRRAGMLQIIAEHRQRPVRQGWPAAAVATYSDFARGDTLGGVPRLLVVLDRRRPAHEPHYARNRLRQRRRSHLFQPPSPLARMTVALSRKLVAAAVRSPGHAVSHLVSIPRTRPVQIGTHARTSVSPPEASEVGVSTLSTSESSSSSSSSPPPCTSPQE